MRYLLLAILLIGTIALVSGSPGITDKELYYVGEQVVFNIPGGITSQLIIDTPEARYRLISAPGETEPFIPQVEGNYTVTLLDNTRNLLMSGQFRVVDRELESASGFVINIDPVEPSVNQNVTIRVSPPPTGEIGVTIKAPGGVFKYVGPWVDSPFTPRETGTHEVTISKGSTVLGTLKFVVKEEPTRLLRTAKRQFGPGEPIVIYTGPGIGETWFLVVNSGGSASKYQGTESQITFSPAASGEQVIQAVSRKGAILDELIVEAGEVIEAVASTDFMVEDHKGVHVAKMSRILHTKHGKEIEISNPTLAVKKIRFRNLKQGVIPTLRIEDLAPVDVDNQTSVQSYAIDPTTLNFTNATVTAEAKGTTLYKCKQYDFSTQVCSGPWEKVRDIIPGEEYRFLLTPEDPLYSETNSSISCTCQDSATNQNSGSLACEVFCSFTINIPANATSYYLQELEYNVTITIDRDSSTFSNTGHYGYFDHDQTHSNLNDTFVGTSTAISTTSVTWTNTSINPTGNYSFTTLDCSNWPNYCNYYIYLNTSTDFQAPGQSKKSPLINISLDDIRYTINYTVPGPFSVVLNRPTTGSYVNVLRNIFNYTPISTNNLTNCSLYTNDGSWGSDNTSTSITNGTFNYLGYTFSGDGTYLWNVECYDSTNTSVFAASNFTLYVDTTEPTVRLRTPANDSTENTSSIVTFTYNVSDTYPIDNCSLYIDGTSVSTDTTITKDTDQTFNYNLANGVYLWGVGCWDVAGNFNITLNFTLNVSVAPKILSGLWYETDTQDCTNSFACQIDARQQTDGTNNYVAGTITDSQTVQIVNATSSYMGSNGAWFNSGSDVDFSTFYNTVGDNGLTTDWYLYILENDGDTTLICSNTAGAGMSSGSASTGTCTPAADVRMQSTDRFLYRIDIDNDPPNRDKTFNHTIDHASSWFNVTNFTQIGTLSTLLTSPIADFPILQGDSFVMFCNVTCETGSCLNVNVYAQHNGSGSWANIAGSGVLTLNGTETNPHSMGTIFNTTLQTNFSIEANTTGVAHIRCNATSTYQSVLDGNTRVTVVNNQAPTITLNAPGNNTWNNSINLTFFYTPNTLGTIANCSLYVNGTFNQTNQTPISVGSSNNFTVDNIKQETYNWSVSCTDIASLTGNSSVWLVHIDQEQPSNITLNAPPPGFLTTSPSILFNFTAIDNRAPNMTCDLIINGTVNQTLIAFNGTPNTTIVNGFDIGFYLWNVSCTDLAGNTNVSETRNFTVTDEAPVVFLYNPTNNSAVNTTSPVLIYNASDNFALFNCSLYVNGIYNQSNQTPLVNGLNNFTINGLSETWYNWSVTCSDEALNNASDGNWTFRVDLTLPIIILNDPDNDTNFTTGTVTFNYTATDYPGTNLFCTIYIDAQADINSTATSGVPKTETGGVYIDGDHNWNVSCLDNATNYNVSETRNFNVNQTPTITQNSPWDGQHLNGAVFPLVYTPADNDGFQSCELYVNGIFNQTNQSAVNNSNLNNFTLNNLGEGYYNWSVACNDSGIYTNRNQTINWTFVVDNTLPIIVLNQPVNNDTINQSTIVFNWTVTDNLATGLLCNLTINQTVNQTNVISTNGGYTTVAVGGFLTADYNWSVTCVDNATNSNTSLTWNFTVQIPPNVTLTNPANDTYDVLTTVTFQYIPNGGTGNFTNCSLLFDGSINQTNTSIVPFVENNFTVVGMGDGKYNWNVQCYDTNDLIGLGEERTYYVDTQPPYSIELYVPPNDSIVVRNNVSFTFAEFDLTSPNATCSIWLDDGISTFELAGNLNLTNATNYTHNAILADGAYLWNVSCVDLAGNYNASVTYNFSVIAPPNVTLQAPPDPTWNNTGNVTFIYFPSDDILVKNCSLFFNGTEIVNDTTINNKQNNTFPRTGLTDGFYNWTVGCYDSDDNFFAPANWSLYVDSKNPFITLNMPTPAEAFTVSDVLFNYTPTDGLAFNLTCDLRIDGTINDTAVVANGADRTTTINGFVDGTFLWNVTCVDQATNQNVSETRNFTVQEPPSILLLGPPNGTRTKNVSVNFSYNPDDNSHSVTGCFLTLNDIQNASNATIVILENQNNITAIGLTHNTYLWDVNCTDPSGNEGNNGTAYALYVDQLGPYINLTLPLIGQTFNNNNISFNWTPTDFPSTTITCNLTVSNTSGPVTVPNVVGISGDNFNATINGLDDGTHTWNVTCADDLGNTNISVNRNFIINQPDLYLNNSRVSFSNTNPDPGEQINISANVSNIGGVDAANANVTFWDGNPLAGGIYIGSMVLTVPSNSSRVFWTLWNITDGYHTIYVSADPSNGIEELNETNNNATATISFIRVNITYPPNNTITTDTTPLTHFNISDFTGGTLDYRVFVDDGLNGQSGTVNDLANNSLNLTALADGIHRIVIEGEDGLGRRKNSTERYITIDTTAPQVAFITVNDSWYNTGDVSIQFNITDMFSTNLNYDLFFNGAYNRSGATTNNSLVEENFTSLPEGQHTIIVEAVDELGNVANSTELVFWVDVTPPVPNITTPNETWFNVTTPTISINITDNLDPTLNYTFFVNGVKNQNGTVSNGIESNSVLLPLAEGTHILILEGLDEAGNRANSTPITIYVDLTAPNVTLLAPANDTNFTVSNINLNFTVDDNMALALICNLTLDGSVIRNNVVVPNGTIYNTSINGLQSGYHYWNATCVDNASNHGYSETWRFFVELADLEINAGNITFSNSTPIENQTIQVNATIFNMGSFPANNITIQFWLGHPDFGGTQINGNITINNISIGGNATVNVSHTAVIGVNRIYVVVDPPLATNGSIPEENESNNIAFNQFVVGLFEVFAGESGNTLKISDAAIISAYQWNQTNVTGSNVFVVDTDSSIVFTSLLAIGRNTSGGTDTGSNDFEEIDTRMGTTNLTDSVNDTFTSGGSPLGLIDIIAYKQNIDNIPVDNSTNTTNFKTGILWDSSDGGAFYNASQDIAFLTVMNQSMMGQYGVYDYEIKVPATLRDYISGGGTVTFYTELR